MADTYTITGSQDGLDVTDPTNPTRQRVITYKSKATGAIGTVRVPLDNLTPEVVDRAVTAAVANLDAIHNL